MTDATTYATALTASILLLRHTLAIAMVDATTACKHLDDGDPRAAVGALIPISRALDDARALLDSILIFNRNLT